jgi:hypothetical protein
MLKSDKVSEYLLKLACEASACKDTTTMLNFTNGALVRAASSEKRLECLTLRRQILQSHQELETLDKAAIRAIREGHDPFDPKSSGDFGPLCGLGKKTRKTPAAGGDKPSTLGSVRVVTEKDIDVDLTDAGVPFYKALRPVPPGTVVLEEEPHVDCLAHMKNKWFCQVCWQPCTKYLVPCGICSYVRIRQPFNRC